MSSVRKALGWLGSDGYVHKEFLIQENSELRASLATERAARESAEQELKKHRECTNRATWRADAAESDLAAMREAIQEALATGAENDLICSDCAQFVFRGILGDLTPAPLTMPAFDPLHPSTTKIAEGA